MQKTTTFLMFVGDQCGKAEEAVNFYTSLFKNAEIKSITHYKTGEPGGKEGQVKNALFSIDGQEYMAMDSAADHKFSFTPSISVFVKCENEEEIDALYRKFMEGGAELMPLANYGFSEKFGWVADKFGVSWQLNLGSVNL